MVIEALKASLENTLGSIDNIYKTLFVYSWNENKANWVLRKHGHNYFNVYERTFGKDVVLWIDFTNGRVNLEIDECRYRIWSGQPIWSVQPEEFFGLQTAHHLTPDEQKVLMETLVRVMSLNNRAWGNHKYAGTARILLTIVDTKEYDKDNPEPYVVHVNAVHSVEGNKLITMQESDEEVLLSDLGGLPKRNDLAETKLRVPLPRKWWKFWVRTMYLGNTIKGNVGANTLKDLLRRAEEARSLYNKRVPVYGLEFVGLRDRSKTIKLLRKDGVMQVVSQWE